MTALSTGTILRGVASPPGPNQINRLFPFEQYAELIVRFWCNVQRDQPVLILTEKVHSELAELVKRKAEERGSGPVTIILKDLEVIHSTTFTDQVATLEKQIQTIAAGIDMKKTALIQIGGSQFPDGFQGLLAERARTLNRIYQNPFGELATNAMNGLINRTLVMAPTKEWAVKVFGGTDPEVSFARLSSVIQSACCLDQEVPVQAFREQETLLHQKRRCLQRLKLHELHITTTDAAGCLITDLRVGLSTEAKWVTGETTVKINGVNVPYYGNAPTFEIFTTPDFRKTRGYFTTTIPTKINGAMVDCVRFDFNENGEVDMSRREYDPATQDFLRTQGSRRLGEIALASMDNPLARHGVLFGATSYDEQLGPHAGLGPAFLFCIKNGKSLLKKPDADLRKAELGINQGGTHLDFTLGNSSTTIVGYSRTGKPHTLIKNGVWAI